MRCPGVHCPGCGEHAGRAVLYGAPALAAVAAAAWIIPRLLWVAATVAACYALAVVLAVEVAPRLVRRRERHGARTWTAQPLQGRSVPLAQVPRAAAPVLEAPRPLAIEPPREIRLHLDVSPEQLAAILRHYTEGV